MRRMTNSFVHSLKDQVRGVRYSLRAEAQTPGSSFPIVQQALGFPPLAMVGSMIGTPAVRLADGLFSQVEHVASDLLQKVERRPDVPFPCPLSDLFPRGNAPETVEFAGTAHREVSRMLRHYGAQNMLVSEQALDRAWAKVLARQSDLGWPDPARKDWAAAPDAAVLICAALAVEFAKARPIQRVDLIKERRDGPRHLMLSPNLYCGLVMGLAIAIVTVRPPAVTADRDAVTEGADAAVDARFERLRLAADSRTAPQAVADEFKAILPYLP